MDAVLVEQQKILLSEFLERDANYFSWDWNHLHYCYDKLCSISLAKNSLDLELIEQTDRIGNAIIANNLDDCFVLVIEAVTWYESLFKKSKPRKQNEKDKDIS